MEDPGSIEGAEKPETSAALSTRMKGPALWSGWFFSEKGVYTFSAFFRML